MNAREASRQRQLALGLGHQPAMTRADFLVGDANRAAVALFDRWPDWPGEVVVVSGPAGSGKTHLVEVWRAASGAAAVPAQSIDQWTVDRLLAGPLAVEDLDAGSIDEPAMFHLINLTRERKGSLVITSRRPPAAIAWTVPDLASRLRAAHAVTLGVPDDDLLRRVLVKLFADRQLAVDRAVIDYVVTRMERSLAAANSVVEALDRAALAEGKGITRGLAAAALDLVNRPPDDPEGS
jgi:chromosomal replication initiation ATPase DnaA